MRCVRCAVRDSAKPGSAVRESGKDAGPFDSAAGRYFGGSGSCGLGRCLGEGSEQCVAGLVDGFGGVEVADGVGLGVELGKAHAGFEEAGGIGQGFEFFVGGGEVGVAVAFSQASFRVDDFGGEQARAVVVQKRREGIVVEVVDRWREAPGDVGVAEVFAYHGGVLALGQGVVVGAPGPGLGELADVEFVEQVGDLVVDVFGTVVGVKALDDKGIGGDQGFEHGDQEALGDGFDGADVLILGDFIDGVDVIDAFGALAVALVDGIDSEEAGLALRFGLSAFADGDRNRSRLGEGGVL